MSSVCTACNSVILCRLSASLSCCVCASLSCCVCNCVCRTVYEPLASLIVITICHHCSGGVPSSVGFAYSAGLLFLACGSVFSPSRITNGSVTMNRSLSSVLISQRISIGLIAPPELTASPPHLVFCQFYLYSSDVLNPDWEL